MPAARRLRKSWRRCRRVCSSASPVDKSLVAAAQKSVLEAGRARGNTQAVLAVPLCCFLRPWRASMRHMRLTCAVLPLLLLAGCSSWKPAPENVKAVPADRLLGYQEPLGLGGQLQVDRDIGGMGAGCYVAVL